MMKRIFLAALLMLACYPAQALTQAESCNELGQKYMDQKNRIHRLEAEVARLNDIISQIQAAAGNAWPSK